MPEVTWFEPKYNLSQVPKGTVQFSWLSKDNKQCHPWVYCKDYLQDAVHATIHRGLDQGSVYGFKFNNDNPPVDLDNMRLMLSNMTDKDFASKQEHMLEFMNIVAEMYEIEPFTLETASNPHPKRKDTGVHILVGHKDWLSSPPMISVMSLLIRMSYGHVKGRDYRKALESTYYHEDMNSYPTACKALQFLSRGNWRNIFGTDIKSNYPAMNMATMHCCGFACWLSGYEFPIKHFSTAPAYTGVKK